jgi:hypothetical protein
VIAVALGATIHRAVIHPDGSGETGYVTPGACSLKTAAGRRRVIRWICVAYAGPETELQLVGEIAGGCETEFAMAKALASRLGLNASQLSVLTRAAVRLVAARRRAIEMTAAALIKRSELTGAEIVEIIQPAVPPPPPVWSAVAGSLC